MPAKNTTPHKKAVTAAKPRQSKAVTDKLSLSPSTPIPFEGGKGFSSANNSYYLPFLDGVNDYGQLLLESRLLSDTHNACVVTKKDYCAGSGFQYSDNTTLPKLFTEWLKTVNRKSEPATEVNKQIFESHFTFGNTPIELIRYTISSKKYFHVVAHNFLNWKLGLPNQDEIVETAIYSKLFTNKDFTYDPETFKKAKTLPIYNPLNPAKKNWKKFNDGTERTLIWYRNAVTGLDFYGLPSAVASLIYQILEYKGARFNLDNFDNNLVASAVIALKGNFSEPEVTRIGKKVISSHTGDGKRGRVIVLGSEEGITGSDVHSLETHKEGSYVESDNIWTQKIILANQWDAVLAGILSASTWGKGTGFLTKILEIKQKTVIKPAQEDLLQKVWKHVIKELGDWTGIKVDTDRIQIQNAIDISGLTDVDITPAVKVDEVRESKGLKKVGGKKGDMFLGELKGSQMKGVYTKDTSKKSGNDTKSGNDNNQ